MGKESTAEYWAREINKEINKNIIGCLVDGLSNYQSTWFIILSNKANLLSPELLSVYIFLKKWKLSGHQSPCREVQLSVFTPPYLPNHTHTFSTSGKRSSKVVKNDEPCGYNVLLSIKCYLTQDESAQQHSRSQLIKSQSTDRKWLLLRWVSYLDDRLTPKRTVLSGYWFKTGTGHGWSHPVRDCLTGETLWPNDTHLIIIT